MLHDVLKDTACALRQILEKSLPSEGDGWWKSCVLEQLSFQQQRMASERGVTTLSGLDLAALLRLTDKNWGASLSWVGRGSPKMVSPHPKGLLKPWPSLLRTTTAPSSNPHRHAVIMGIREEHSSAQLMQSIDVQYLGGPGFTPTAISLRYPLRTAKTQNWHIVSQSGGFSAEVRNWLKEAQTIRNRWAHLPPAGLPPTDVYRDADTLFRLMRAAGADAATLSEAERVRDNAMKGMQLEGSASAATTATEPGGPFQKGDLVRLRASPDQVGAVVDVLEGAGEWRIQVFHDGKIATYYASQVELSARPEMRLSVAVEALHAALTAL